MTLDTSTESNNLLPFHKKGSQTGLWEAKQIADRGAGGKSEHNYSITPTALGAIGGTMGAALRRSGGFVK